MPNSISFDPLSMLQPGRVIRGASAILLPLSDARTIDWSAWEAHLSRTVEAGLTPAVNMDTGYVNLLGVPLEDEVLARTQTVLGGQPFIAGAFVGDEPGAAFNLSHYASRMEKIAAAGGLPIIFQSFGLTSGGGPEILARYEQLASRCDGFLGFELTTDLARFGKVYDLETFTGLLKIRQCIGAKHSSFHREPEFERLVIRDRERPDFILYTGNDLAIDMVMYGSDYLLGLSTFAPDLFARRDRYWRTRDARFFELNDQLQYLGAFAFRNPGAAYKHTAAQFLKLRGWARTDFAYHGSPTRPATDVPILREIALMMGLTPVA
ncbi:MAG: dihydrodipicolinate synthase family protein [Planctomyces sp.]|nr:dihydrodipicolinate synthase family protein [Planctomyces sp.]